VATQRFRTSRTQQRRARQRNEESHRNRVFFVGLAILFIILMIPTYGYYSIFVAPPREWIVKVNDTTYNLGYLVKLLRIQQAGNLALGQSMNLSSSPFSIVNGLAENELIQQAAPRYNILFNEEDVKKEIQERILGDVTEDETPLDQLEREFQERYSRYLNLIQLSEPEHKEVVIFDMHREAMRELLGEKVANVLPQVYLLAIDLPTADNLEEIAEEFRTEYSRGATFSSLVEKFGTDQEAVRVGGEVGWIPEGILPEVDALLFEDLAIDQLSDPIPKYNPSTGETIFTLYLVTDKSEGREVEKGHREILKLRALEDWLIKERQTNDVDTRFTSTQYEWVAKQLELSDSSS